MKLSRQFGAANVYTALRRLAALTAAGAAVGLILLVVGAVLHSGRSLWGV